MALNFFVLSTLTLFVWAKTCWPSCIAVETFPGPSSPSNFQSWLQQWESYRKQTLNSVSYTPKVYDNDLLWTQTSFMQPQMMAHEKLFFDNNTNTYTIDKWFQFTKDAYGGVDSVLIWPTYPNIGVDARNQFDMVRDMPEGFKQAIADLKSRYNVSTLLPYNPWDSGTNVPANSFAVEMASLIADLGADGFNGDTLEVVPQAFWDAAVQNGGPIAIEPEEGGDAQSLWYTKMGWGYWSPYPYQPTVDRWKWLEHRHITNVCERWATDRHDGLQYAFFNGDGYETWQNVWGIYNSISQRDAAAIRRVGSLLRFAGGLFGGGNSFDAVHWVPFDPAVPRGSGGVFASRFQTSLVPAWGRLGRPGWLTSTRSQQPFTVVRKAAPRLKGAHEKVQWSIVNRDDAINNVVISLPNNSSQVVCYDLYHGQALKTSRAAISLDNFGYGCVMCLPSTAVDATFNAFLSEMASMTQQPLSSLSTNTPVLSQSMTVYAQPNSGGSTTGMKLIPGGQYSFYSRGREIEGQQRPGVDFQYFWESQPQLKHYHTFQLSSFYIDEFPVTNAQYQAFVLATGYQPTVQKNFLRDWNGRHYPAGWARKPVTWVDMLDAAAYCQWKGARLPNEWEWQRAAQGDNSRVYPWGSSFDPTRVPTPFTGNTLPGPADVDAHPTGASPYGVQDLVGNVWQWTNTFSDEHTRAASLKGGSYYAPQGSKWYFPNGEPMNRVYAHGKLLLIGPSLDRNACTGFRCVMET